MDDELVRAATDAKNAMACFNPECVHPRNWHRADPKNIVNAPIGEGHATICEGRLCDCRCYMRGYYEIRLDAAIREARAAVTA